MSHELFFKLQGTIMNLGNKLTVFQIKFKLFKKYKKVHFFIEFLDNARGWYILHKS